MAQPILGLCIFVPTNPRLQLVATGVNRLDPFIPLFASPDLFGPPWGSLPHPSSVPCSSSRYPQSSDSSRLILPRPGAMVIHLMRILYSVFDFRSVTCFVPVLTFPALDPSFRLSSQFRGRNRLLHSRNRLLPRRSQLLLRRPRSLLRRPRLLSRRFRRFSESSRNKAPVLKPSRRGMYAVNLSRQAYLRRRFVHCLLSSVHRPWFNTPV